MEWLISIALVFGGAIALRLVWKLLSWLGVHGSWPGDPGGSI